MDEGQGRGWARACGPHGALVLAGATSRNVAERSRSALFAADPADQRGFPAQPAMGDGERPRVVGRRRDRASRRDATASLDA
jgi:hypothetical protein